MNAPSAQLIGEVSAWRQEGQRLVLNCRTSEGATAQILVEAPASDVVRLRMIPDSMERPRPASLVIERPGWTAPAVEVKASNGVISLCTGTLTLQITESPWRFALLDGNGAVIMSDNHTDVRNSTAPQTPPLGFTVADDGRCSGVQAGFRLFPEEQLYGFGEKFNDFARRGQRLDTRNVDIGTATTQRAYKNVPFFMSTRGYGVLVHTAYNTDWDLGASSSEGMGFWTEDSQLDLFFFYGPRLSSILDRFTELTGKPFKPPKWFYGLWMSRFTYASEAEVKEVCAKLREYRVPCDVIHLDPGWLRDNHHCDFLWDLERFPDPARMIAEMHADGFKLDLWVCAWIPINTPIFEEMRDRGFLVKGPDGEPFTFSNAPNVELTRTRGMIFPDWRPGLRHGRPDFSHPGISPWLKTEKLKPLVEMGVDAILTDQSEYVEDQEQFANGLTGKEMHNVYTTLFNDLFADAFEEYAPERECVVVARAGYIGNHARTVSMVGDQLSEFFFLPHVIQASLSASMCGIAVSGDDIGGITGTRMPTPELYTRWAQYGLMSAYARCHGTSPREPWEYGDVALRIFRELTEFRYRLIPYLYSYGVVAHQTGMPLMRPMVLEFQEDKNTYALGLQYMLGRELLVAPIYDETNRRSIYFPEGRWTHYWDKREIIGPVHLDWEAPLEEIPLFVRAGSILPLGPVMQHTGERPLDSLTLEIYPGGDASFHLYDEQDTFDFRATEETDRTLILHVDGTRDMKQYEFQILGGRRPRNVALNGKDIERANTAGTFAQRAESWRYDSRKKLLHIKAPGGRKLDVRVR